MSFRYAQAHLPPQASEAYSSRNTIVLDSMALSFLEKAIPLLL